jgi:hypothetical protein
MMFHRLPRGFALTELNPEALLVHEVPQPHQGIRLSKIVPNVSRFIVSHCSTIAGLQNIPGAIFHRSHSCDNLSQSFWGPRREPQPEGRQAWSLGPDRVCAFGSLSDDRSGLFRSSDFV